MTHSYQLIATKQCNFCFSLREFQNLQSECESVAHLFKNVNELVVEQAPMINQIEENVEVAEIHVTEGTRQLQIALNYKKTMYPLVGGFIGACMLVSFAGKCLMNELLNFKTF
jgi:hypothetical protein